MDRSKRIASLLILLCFPLLLKAQPLPCSADPALTRLLEFDDLFLGEIHGTAETPRFMQCLVETALAESDAKLIVSLELSPIARNPLSPFWKIDTVEDGRASRAMYQLVSFLVEKENEGLLTLHFQHASAGMMMRPPAKTVGLELQALAQDAQVIALAGNMHSRKTPPADFPKDYEIEGMFVGPSFTHIMIMSAHGGEGWNCKASCGINTIGPWRDANISGDTLIDGSSNEHDYIYFPDIEAFTASPPMDIDDKQ